MQLVKYTFVTEHAHYIEFKKHKYQTTNNPLYVWSALQTCLNYELKIPEWIKEYLLSSTNRLLSIVHKRDPSDAEKTAVWIQEALSLNPGPGNDIFSDFKRYWRDRGVYEKVRYKLYSGECKSKEDAYQVVADEISKDQFNDKLSDSMVKKIFLKIEKEEKLNPFFQPLNGQ